MRFEKLKAPNTFFLIFMLMVLTAILTWIIPGGEFARELINGRNVVIPGSFKFIGNDPQSYELFLAPIRGFIDAADVIGFVLIVGGAFGIFQKTEAVDSAIMGIAKAHKKSKLVRMLVIPLFMILFSLAGAIFGMSEEVIPFVLVFIPMALMLGYDSITGVAIPFVGAGAGFAGAFINPFTVGIAQAIAGLQPLSGMYYRIFSWLIVTSVAIAFVMIYASRIKRSPEKSPTYENDKIKKKEIDHSEIDAHEGVSGRHKSVLLTFLAGLTILVIGVTKFEWWIPELSALFFILGITVGIIGKLSINETANSFVKGAKDLTATVLVITLARGILIIARDGHIIDTILYGLSNPISSLHPIVSSQAMLLVQTLLNFFVPSGSGQAVLTMPIMAPLADLVDVSRQTAVLAFQFGDGFSNLIIPTSAVTMGILTLADIPWDKWAKWILPLEIIFIIVGALLLIPPFIFGWS